MISLTSKTVVGWVVALAAVNVGLSGVIGVDVVQAVFGGPASVITKVVYGLIGVAGLYKAYHLAMGKKR